MSHRLQVTLDNDLYEALQSEADRTGASLAELVRRSVADRLGVQSIADRLAILDRTAGIWRDRDESGTELQAELRGALATRPVPRVSTPGVSRRRRAS